MNRRQRAAARLWAIYDWPGDQLEKLSARGLHFVVLIAGPAYFLALIHWLHDEALLPRLGGLACLLAALKSLRILEWRAEQFETDWADVEEDEEDVDVHDR